jgi:hypothetical protein
MVIHRFFARLPGKNVSKNMIYSMPSVRLVAFLTSLALIATLRAATPTSAENPVATPAPTRSPYSLKDTVPVESLGKGFQVVPGKDPNGWSFILEPYLWALGVDGTVGVKGFDSHVDFNPLDVVKHLDWGIMAKGEVRKGKWGILGDGFYAELSASGDTPGPLYNNANIKLQQGMAELALAYRIIDDRRGFLDIYAGARYNYFGIDIGTSIDDAGVQDVGNSLAGNIASRVEQRADAIIAQNAAILQSDLQNQITRGVTNRVLEDWANTPRSVTDFLSDRELSNVFQRVGSQFRDFAAAVAAADIAAAKNQLTASIQNRVADAQKELAKALAKQIEQALPTSKSGDRWWIDPIIGLRGQVNFTRWLFLALQGDVGGFGAGSQIAWFASGAIGINITRHVFLETGYRFFYMDYIQGGLTYDAAESGLFMGVGVKF